MTDSQPYCSGLTDEPAPSCGAAMFGAEEFLLLWCNERFLDLLPEARRPNHVVGRSFAEISPISWATKKEALRRVADTGRCETGVDRIFSVEDGVHLYRWALHRPQQGVVLALIDHEPGSPGVSTDSQLSLDG